MHADDLGSDLPDPCLVHHFIRVHGRRPDADELSEIERHTDPYGDDVVPPNTPGPLNASATARETTPLPWVLRREVARLLGRI